MIPASEALARLKEGNRRFAASAGTSASLTTPKLLRQLTAGQWPFAVVLGCSDSRVPPEFVFDQGIGDLFVIRVAGNIPGPPQVGSVEFGVEKIGARLVVVLGHSSCGAVLATLEALENPQAVGSQDLQSVVDYIRPAVEGLQQGDPIKNPDLLVREAVRANIRATAAHLRSRSPVLKQQIEEGGLLIVEAEYALETGVVEFFDGMPAAA